LQGFSPPRARIAYIEIPFPALEHYFPKGDRAQKAGTMLNGSANGRAKGAPVGPWLPVPRWRQGDIRSKISRQKLVEAQGLVPTGLHFDPSPHGTKADLAAPQGRRRQLRNGLSIAGYHDGLAVLDRADELSQAVSGFGYADIHASDNCGHN
jgi:hypothetical protein